MSIGEDRQTSTVPLPEVAPRPHSRRRRWVLLILVAVAVAALAYVGAAVAVTGRVAPGTSVAGVAVGGLRAGAVQDRLAAALTGSATSTLTVAAADRPARLVPADAGLVFDPATVAAQLTAFSLDPRRMIDHLSGGGEVVPEADSRRLDAALRAVATELDVPGADAKLSFDGARAVVTAAVPGRSIDRERAAVMLRSMWLGADGVIVLPTTTVQPAVTTQAMQEAVDRLVTPAVAAPLTVAVNSDKAVLPPEAIAPTLSLERQDDGSLALSVDGKAMLAAVIKAAPGFQADSRNARIVLSAGKPTIIPSVTGKTIAPAELAAAATVALGRSDPAGRTAVVKAVESQPTFTTEQAKALGIVERTSFSATNLTSNPGRTANLRLAASKINGMIVKPGETFSLNKVLGERTAARGWNKAPIIIEGRLVNDYGGGVSQMATSIFNNVFFTGLEDIEHKPHSFYISRYPEGREATVHYPELDLRWRNDSPYGVLIDAAIRQGQVQVGFWSTKVWDIESVKSPRTNYRAPKTIYDSGPGCISMAGSPGFDVTVTRVFRKDGKVVRRESFKTSYNAENRVVCSARPSN